MRHFIYKIPAKQIDLAVLPPTFILDYNKNVRSSPARSIYFATYSYTNASAGCYTIK